MNPEASPIERARVQAARVELALAMGDEDRARSARPELDRIAIFGRLDGQWFVAVMIVDGDGNAHGMSGKRDFPRRGYAMRAFADA